MRYLLYPVMMMILCIVSCRDNVMQERLAGDEYKLWLRLDNDSLDKRHIFEYFDRDGSFRIFIKYPTGKFVEYYVADLPFDHHWDLRSNDTLVKAERVCYVIHMNDSTMTLGFPDNSSTDYVIAPDSLIPHPLLPLSQWSIENVTGKRYKPIL